jgi:hypothetical protein
MQIKMFRCKESSRTSESKKELVPEIRIKLSNLTILTVRMTESRMICVCGMLRAEREVNVDLD